jgi:hypothetical protein
VRASAKARKPGSYPFGQKALFLALLFILGTSVSQARPRITPKFGTPLVTSNQLIFAYPDARKPAIIGIDRGSGAKLWELPVTNKDVQLWHTTSNPIVSIDTKLFELNLSDHSLQLRFTTDFQIETLREISAELFLLQQRAADIRTNKAIVINRNDWTQLWSRTNLYQCLDSDSDRILVQFAEPDFSGRNFVSHGWPMKNMAIALLNSQNGQAIWQRPSSNNFIGESAVLSDKYVVIISSGQLACASARDGSVLSQTNTLRADTFANVWHDSAGLFSNLSVNLVASLDLPSLTSKILFRHDEPGVGARHRQFAGDIYLLKGMYGTCAYDTHTGRRLWPVTTPRVLLPDAELAWEGVHNNILYFSRATRANDETAIYSLDIKTGQSRKLFSAPLPRE